MPLRSLRTRLVALFLVSLDDRCLSLRGRRAAAVHPGGALARPLRSESPVVADREADRGVRREAPQRRGGRAARLRDQPGRHHERQRLLRRAVAASRAPIDEVNFGKAPKGTEERLELVASGQEGQGADAQPEARRRHLDDRGRRRLPLRQAADRRDRRRAAGALDQHLDARPGPPLRAAAAAGPGRRGARRTAAQPAHHAPGARADRGQRAHRAAATTTCT